MTNKDVNSKERALIIAFRMFFGEKINVKETAETYGVSKRTILRDISSIRHVLADKDLANYRFELKYNEGHNNYNIFDNGVLTLEEALLVLMTLACNIPDINSDSLNKVSKGITDLVATSKRRQLGPALLNAKESYMALSNKKDILPRVKKFLIWTIDHKTIHFTDASADCSLDGVPLSIFVRNRDCFVLMYVAGDINRNIVYPIDKLTNLSESKKEIKISRTNLESHGDFY